MKFCANMTNKWDDTKVNTALTSDEILLNPGAKEDSGMGQLRTRILKLLSLSFSGESNTKTLETEHTHTVVLLAIRTQNQIHTKTVTKFSP